MADSPISVDKKKAQAISQGAFQPAHNIFADAVSAFKSFGSNNSSKTDKHTDYAPSKSHKSFKSKKKSEPA